MIFLKTITLTLFVAALVYHCHAAPAISSNVEDQPLRFQQASNFSSTRSLTDRHPHFTIRVNPVRNTQIDTISMLFIALDALTIVALRGPRSRIQARSFRLADYPAVAIDLIPKHPAATVTDEVVDQCIYYGIEDIVRHEDYRETTLICEWDQLEVARLRVWNRSPRAEHLQNLSGPSMPDTTTNANASLSATLRPQFFYPQNAAHLDQTLVFITVMNAIMRFSWLGRDPVGQRWTDPGPGWDASFVIGPNNPPRAFPPILEPRWVIQTLRLVPECMRRNGRWSELGMSFEVDGVYLGNALLMKGRGHPDAGTDKYVTAMA
ncbi:MAG: hypothetical protein Q9213_001273 [Squamulea squamosa]